MNRVLWPKFEQGVRIGFPNGVFTAALLKVWNNGAFNGNYVTFMNEIIATRAASIPEQVPVLAPEVPPAFSSQQLFSI
jgi:hypothetical protein